MVFNIDIGKTSNVESKMYVSSIQFKTAKNNRYNKMDLDTWHMTAKWQIGM